jgi:hypothetical protein
MLERLKGLPLTIILTILIWMYAESQFTASQPDVRLNVQVVTTTPDYQLIIFDADRKTTTKTMNLVVTLQGPQNQIKDIYQESLQLNPDEPFPNLTYTPTATEMAKATANAGPGGSSILDVNTAAILDRSEFFRSQGVTVTHVSPAHMQIIFEPVVKLQKHVEFRSQLVDQFTLSPDVVEIRIARAALQKIGGADQLRVVAVESDPSRSLATLTPDAQHTIRVRFVAEYNGTRNENVTVLPREGTLSAHIVRQQQAAVQIPDVPVWLGGPPEVLGKYQIDVQPKSTSVTVTGTTTLIENLRNRLDAGGTRASGVQAYLDITPDDKPTDSYIHRRLRYILPDGLTLVTVPVEVGFRMMEKSNPPASAPGIR